MSGDPGGIPLYKNGVAVGGVGVEGDGIYTIDRVPTDNDQAFEEIIAVAAAQNFSAPAQIRADNVLIEGIRLPFSNVTNLPSATQIPFANLPGIVIPGLSNSRGTAFGFCSGHAERCRRRSRAALLSGSWRFRFIRRRSAANSRTSRANREYYQSEIRQPLGSNARVSITVVDVDGSILGIFRLADAPLFGYDVSAQKARTTAFFARTDAGAQLQAAGFGSFVARAAADGIGLNGSTAFSARAIGFLHRPLFPDGINNTEAGPFSTSLGNWSPFNVGLQLELVRTTVMNPFPPMCRKISMKSLRGCGCTQSLPGIQNGIQIFAGGMPLYRGNTLVGAIGISGDGIEQDDFISAGGANNFAAPRGDAFRPDFGSRRAVAVYQNSAEPDSLVGRLFLDYFQIYAANWRLQNSYHAHCNTADKFGGIRARIFAVADT